MNFWHRSRVSLIATISVALAFLLWTLLFPGLAETVDAWWPFGVPARESVLGQIAAAVSLIFTPVVIIVLMLVAAWWAKNRRLHALAGAIVLASVLSWSSVELVKHIVARPRPDSPWDYLISSTGMSYPSSQVAATTSAAILMVALTSLTRHSWATVLTWRVVGFLAVIVVALDRLLLHAHRVSDVVGGLLLGGLATSLSLLICDVQTVKTHRDHGDRGRSAIVYNPTKIPDPTTFMRLVESAATEAGWDTPIWLATSPTDPGHAMAAAARDAEVDLIMIAGGDGTVRVVCGEMAGTGITVAIIPAGTGNLLARNLDIPLDYSRALRLLDDGRVADLDLIRFTGDGNNDKVEYSAVMAGVGVDAAIMEDTDEDLKRQIGSLAYVAAGLNHIKASPMKARLSIDDDQPEDIEASLVSIGNVGDLQAGVTIMPEASASDGRMDLLLANPGSAAEITQMAAAMLADPDNVPHLVRRTARHVQLELDEPTQFQIDGDVIGEVQHLDAEIMEHAVKILVPNAKPKSYLSR